MVLLIDDDGQHLGEVDLSRWITVKPNGTSGITIGSESYQLTTLSLVPQDDGQFQLRLDRKINDHSDNDSDKDKLSSYAGSLRVHRRDDGSLDIINLIDVESYVAAVVAAEIWPIFHDEAYQVQAIIARTYVLYHMQRRQNAEFDVNATQGSQVYKGVRTDQVGRRAKLFTDRTRGLACTWEENGRERLFCTYYSSACGGRSQSAAIFGEDSNIKPLSGGVSCDYCKIAPGDTYRWGPVRVPGRKVVEGLKDRYPKNFTSKDLRKITVIERTPHGRPVRIRLMDSGDQHFDILAERFRHVVGPSVMRSTDCTVRVDASDVVFEHGRGFGHGLGLCQWGSQGQAQASRKAAEILRYYYPGANIRRVY